MPLVLWVCDSWEAAQTEVGVLERMSWLEIIQVVSIPRAVTLGLSASIFFPSSAPSSQGYKSKWIPQTRINNISSQILMPLQQQAGMFFPLGKKKMPSLALMHFLSAKFHQSHGEGRSLTVPLVEEQFF